jgi:AraC family transcriptional regulator, regulatory protein of adaptative response / DNA-3-methyladenine glycosylase II
MQTLDPITCYAAITARDVRQDGRFFTAVKTTGIYCRPICPAQIPKPENCSFYAHAAQAQAAGYRPCLRCRPEVAPQTPAWAGTLSSVNRAIALIEDGALDSGDVETLAGRVGLGGRHLRRLFEQHLGVGPLAVAQTRRVHLAKQLITETVMPLGDIALAAGFGSVRRFNACFQDLYGRPPRDMRRAAHSVEPMLNAPSPSVRLRLPVRRPYDWERVASFFVARAITGLETVCADAVSRAFALPVQDGVARGAWLVTPLRDASDSVFALSAQVRVDRAVALPVILNRLARMFDTVGDVEAIEGHLAQDPDLAPHVASRSGLRTPGAWDPFETGVRAILGQQVTLAAAAQLGARLVATLGAETIGWDGVPARLFPDPQTLADADLSFMPMPRARSATLGAFARAVLADPRLLDPWRPLDETLKGLQAIPGIGPWTAGYIALRALNHHDAFPPADAALRQVAARLWPATSDSPGARDARLLTQSRAWSPWRGRAAQLLWSL